MIRFAPPLDLTASVHNPLASAGDPAPYAGADSFTFVLVRLSDADGTTGYGVTGRFLAPQVAHLLNTTVAALLPEAGDDPVTWLSARLNPRGMTGVMVSALSAFDIALVDLAAKRQGVTAASLLGAARSAAPCHVTCGFPALDTDALVEACGREIAQGAAGVKVLVAAKGRTVAEDVMRLTAVRDAIGYASDLIADANCGMDLETALEFSRSVTDLNLAWLEEPIRGNDRHALAALASEGIVPLGAGQMEQSPDRFALLSEAGVGIIQPNAVFSGGIGSAIQIARQAVAMGRSVSPAGGWEGINLHWMCGALSEGAVEIHRAQARMTRLLFADAMRLEGGVVRVPDMPGFGFRLDEAGLANCRSA